MSHIDQFDYVTINDNFYDAAEELKSIIMAENLRTEQQISYHQELIEQLTK